MANSHIGVAPEQNTQAAPYPYGIMFKSMELSFFALDMVRDIIAKDNDLDYLQRHDVALQAGRMFLTRIHAGEELIEEIWVPSA